MTYSIEFTREATKALAKVPRTTRELLVNKIELLAQNPFDSPNVKQLVGQPGYRLRVGDWRVLYDIVSERVVVRVLRISPRGGAYR